MGDLRRRTGSAAIGSVVAAAMSVVLGLAVAHRGSSAPPAGGAADARLTPCGIEGSTRPAASSCPPAPAHTFSTIQSGVQSVVPPPGVAALHFSGPLDGAFESDGAQCQQNIPTGNQGPIGGLMPTGGLVAGRQFFVQIWSTGPAPGRVETIEVTEGSPGGTYLYGSRSPQGLSHFDWARGVTLDVTLPAVRAGDAPLHITGTINCGVLQDGDQPGGAADP